MAREYILTFIIVFIFLVSVSAVNRPPGIFIQPQKNLHFKPKETVELPCVATGFPKPTYKWKFNGKDFNPSGQDDRVLQLPNQGTIVFNAPEDKDEGIYQCFADNGYGVSASVKCNLREAKLASFPIEEARTHRVYAGDSLMLPCTPPTSYPAADVYWVVKEPDGRFTPLNFGKRFTMDLEGRLRFVNIEKGDAKGGKAYACHAINYFMRKDVPGPEHYIEVLGSSEQKYPAWEFWTSPSDHFALKGNQLKLKCIFAGNPTPDVFWTKIEGTKEVELPPNSKFKAFGMTLEINNIRIEDAGQYECMGLNTETLQRATKAFNVRVESAPYWINEPKDQEKSIGEKATFICRAGGIPEPSYIWYINGVPLVDVTDPRIYQNIRFKKPDQNNITITDLTLEDHLNIQCNATNKHGYKFADVFLNVMGAAQPMSSLNLIVLIVNFVAVILKQKYEYIEVLCNRK